MANIHWIIEKAREFQKNICFTDYAKAFDYVDHNKLWKILKRWEYQTNLPASWETFMQVKKQHLEQDIEAHVLWLSQTQGNLQPASTQVLLLQMDI